MKQTLLLRPQVTPCVGVWIEILDTDNRESLSFVTPCVGVWIEIEHFGLPLRTIQVTPCVGVWIEMA